MAANSEHIIGLLERYSGGQATATEVEQLFTLLRTGDYDETVVSFIETQLETFEPDNTEDIAFWQSRLEGGAQRITGVTATESNIAAAEMPVDARPVHRVHFLRKWGWAAAAIVIGLGIGIYLWNPDVKQTEQRPVAVTPTAVPYGKNGAVLTLADGRQVVLDSLGNGVVANQNGTQVVLKGGALAYDASGSAQSEVAYNKMATPYGRQFQVTLPDGTKVWLNAASSISFPTVFSGTNREVSVTGEVYFEVAKNAAKPFIVKMSLPSLENAGPRHARIEVLGTHFNVNTYSISAKTTLLEGSLRVVNEGANAGATKGKPVILKPGEQSIADGYAQINIDHSPDIDKVMAWKNGVFNFEGATFREIMEELERWYDVEVVYEKTAPGIEFEGKMTRDVPLIDLLKMLERSDIHYRKEGRKLIILP